VFDSRPSDEARAAALRNTIKNAMAWGIGALVALLVGAAGVIAVATIQYYRRQRPLGTVVPRASTAPGEAPASMYDRVSWWDQHAVLVRGAVVFLIAAAAIGALGLLVWGMKTMYLQP
jgi:hypothetical protein